MDKPLVVITGASSGIGAATAELFSRHGYPLLLIARRLDRLEQLNLPNAICAKADVLDLPEFKAAVQSAQDRYGPVDCMINNAGVMLLGNAQTQPIDEWKRMLDVNIAGVLNGINIVLSDMVERKEGTIINVSSLAGRKIFPSHSVYCGTKSAVHAIGDGMREEVAPHNVRVITIAPGAAESELLSHTTSEDIKKSYNYWKKSIGGVMRSEDVANAILYAYSQPQNVCVREIVLAPTGQQT
jgi:NADP-dependent 3-hydroxy acid dehydrogenase YdfG